MFLLLLTMPGSQADEIDWENLSNKELHDKFQQMMTEQVQDVLNNFEEVAVVVGRHETCSDDILHLRPSSDGWFTSCLMALDDLFPPNEDIVLELKGCHRDLLLFFIIVQTEDLVNFQCP